MPVQLKLITSPQKPLKSHLSVVFKKTGESKQTRLDAQITQNKRNQHIKMAQLENKNTG